MFVNVAAYQFVQLTELSALRARLLALCKAGALRGTILLSVEGINLFVAGAAEEIDRLLEALRALPGLENLTPKVSESAHQPFHRMLVRIKKEIIAFGIDGIDPATRPSPKIAPATLKQWLDEGRPLTLLDTRNDYEVKLGTFAGARDLGITQFRQFPSAVQQLPEELKTQPMVMFCTGGIRCEKAGPYLEQLGFQNIFQLDGGILKYFEDCGGEHYQGECFVFDQRVGLDPNLHETDAAQCFACQASLTLADLRDPRYSPPQTCPFCYRPPTVLHAELFAKRQAAIWRATHPLPGIVPFKNERPLHVPAAAEGLKLSELLQRIFPQISEQEWTELFAKGAFLDAQGIEVSADHRVRAGERYVRVYPGTIEPEVATEIRLLHEDQALLAVHKPAPLPMHPSGRFNRHTLQHFLAEVYAPEKPRPVHRLDANTTGVVLLARSRHFAHLVQPQFTRGTVEKVYLAKVRGVPEADTFSCDAPILDEPTRLGAREIDFACGQKASTKFVVKARAADGTTLLEVRPVTGRTNQIRLHLAHLGFPICGDPTYLSATARGEAQTLPLGAPPLCLHAWKLQITHPLTGDPLALESAPPTWANAPAKNVDQEIEEREIIDLAHRSAPPA